MIRVGGFKSQRSVFGKFDFVDTPLELHAWVRGEIGLVSPFVNWLMSPIARSGCVPGAEQSVELAHREAVSNAILHGNSMDAHKLVRVRCCCEGTNGVFIVVRDQGRGFEASTVPNPLAVDNLEAENGRGIHRMTLVMDEVSFEPGGTKVHSRKLSGNAQKTPAHSVQECIAGRSARRPWPGVRAVESG